MKETTTYYEVCFINSDGRREKQAFKTKGEAMRLANIVIPYLPNDKPDLSSVRIYEVTTKEIDFEEE